MEAGAANDSPATVPSPAGDPSLAQPQRYPSLDIARGIIMIIMALDHTSVAWNAGRPVICLEGLPAIPTFEYATIWQQMTREVTHICAPGFQFLAGMGLAISVFRRRRRSQSEWSISGDMIARGLVLCACDFGLMYWAYGQHPFALLVLACIGCSMIAFSLLRKLPVGLIAALSIGIILGAPLYGPAQIVQATAQSYFRNILSNVALTADPPNAYMIIYPILPWIGCFGLGWCFGEMYERGVVKRGGRMVTIGAVLFVAAVLLRWFGGSYGDRLPMGGGPWSLDFWIISKYPPSIVFLTSMIGVMLVLIGLLRPLDTTDHMAPAWRVPLIFGQVALFFFIAHFYLYGLYPSITGTRLTYGLPTTYAVWLVGLAVLFFPCTIYNRLRRRYRTVLRYL